MLGRSVGIVGGGVAGLALAALLAGRGHAVTLCERAELGGKLERHEVGGSAVDTGPSLFTFPGVWRRFLARLGETDPLALERLPGLGDHLVQGVRLPLPVPPNHPLFPHWARYEAEVAPLKPHVETLLTTPPRPLESAFLRASLALGRVVWPHLSAEGWLRARNFPPPLHAALAVHALNAGVPPRRAPALYALLPALIARDVWRPAGGMFALVETLIDFARARGAELQAHAPALALDPRTGSLTTTSGARRFGVLVSALDPARLGELLGRPARPAPLSVSGVGLYAPAPHLALPPTTVVPPSDFGSFEAALRLRALPPDTLALIHHLNGQLSVLLAAPPTGRPLDADHPWVVGQVERLEGLLDVSLRATLRGALTLTPAHYALGGAAGGAIYGRVFSPWRAGPFHPEPYRLGPRLWQVGAGVHPGGGLPAVLGGALMVDELLG